MKSLIKEIDSGTISAYAFDFLKRHAIDREKNPERHFLDNKPFSAIGIHTSGKCLYCLERYFKDKFYYVVQQDMFYPVNPDETNLLEEK